MATRKTKKKARRTLTGNPTVIDAIQALSGDLRGASYLALSATRISSLVTAAVESGVLPKSALDTLPQLVAGLASKRVTAILSGDVTVGVRPAWIIAIRALPLSDSVRQRIAGYMSATVEGLDLWTQIGNDKDIAAADVLALQRAETFLDVTGNYTWLLRTLLTDSKQAADALAPSVLVARSAADWYSLLTKSVAAGAEPNPQTVKVAFGLMRRIEVRYATEKLRDRLSRDTSTRSALGGTADDVIAFLGLNPSFDLVGTPLAASAAGELYDARWVVKGLRNPTPAVKALVAYQRIYRLADASATTLGSAAPANLAAPVSRFDVTDAIIVRGLTSALGIAAFPYGTFISEVPPAGSDSQQYAAIHSQALKVSWASLHFAVVGQNLGQNLLPRVLPVAPNWQQMFGPLQSCLCDECQSFHGPSAYLFDCLKFLEDQPLGGGTNALSTLQTRRNDLTLTALTCDNAFTVLPYLDLVNELLERLVAGSSAFTPFQLAAAVEADLANATVSATLRTQFLQSANKITLGADATVHSVAAPPGTAAVWYLLDQGNLYRIVKQGAAIQVADVTPQTSASAEELRANPEHICYPAYTKLLASVYPWTLPFDLAWREIVQFLSRIDTSVAAILDAVKPLSTPTADRLNPYEARDAVAGAFLRVDPTTFQILTGQKAAGDGPVVIGQPNDHPEDFWGFARGVIFSFVDWDGHQVAMPWTQALWRVPQFLQRAQMVYLDLLGLLDGYFINPLVTVGGNTQRTLSIASLDPSDPASCKLDRLAVQGANDAATVVLAKSLHRFIRLQRALAWVPRDLDRALLALGSTAVDHDAVVGVSMIERLRKRTGLTIREIVGWCNDIDHLPYLDVAAEGMPALPSFYDEVYRAGRIDANSPFVTDASQLSGTLTANAMLIAGRLGITDDDLSRLRQDTRVIAAADVDTLSLKTLSALTRYASLARALGVGTDDVLDMATVLGATPFAIDAASGPIARANAPLRFAEALDVLATLSLTPHAALYLLQDTGNMEDPPALTDLAIGAAVTSLCGLLRPLITEVTYSPDATGQLLSRELIKLGWSQDAASRAGRFFASREVYSASVTATAGDVAAIATVDFLTYDSRSNILSTTHAMTTAEMQALQGVNGVSAAFVAAVAALHDAPRTYASQSLRYIAMPERSTALSALPSNVQLPDSLSVLLGFDADRRLLIFRGDVALLADITFPAGPLDPSWTAFKAAVTALSTDPPPGAVTLDPPAADNRFFADAADLEAKLAMSPEDLCTYASQRVAVARWRALSVESAGTTLASSLNLDPNLVRVCQSLWLPLVVDSINGGPSPLVLSSQQLATAGSSAPAAVIRRLHKISLTLEALNLPLFAAIWLLRNGPTIGGPNLMTLPAQTGDAPVKWDAFVRLAEFAAASKTYVSGEATLIDLLDLVINNPTATSQDWSALVERIKGWDAAMVNAVTGTHPFPNTFEEPQTYLHLAQLMGVAYQCGVSAGAVSDWSIGLASSPGGQWTGSNLSTIATQVKAAVRSKVGRQRWLQIATEVNDPLRELRRDALLAYLLGRPNPWDGQRLSNADQFFDYLLIDTQMDACMLTSRIKQASSSVQTFIQRCLMNLEPGVSLGAEAAWEWNEWRSQFRVWEANRKVFAYPENWLLPELRDDKSEAFVTAESGLLQTPPTAGTARTTLWTLAASVASLSALELIGLYRERELDQNGNSVDRVHVIGRDRSPGRAYYYRQLLIGTTLAVATWSPWEKVDADIEGDFVLPFGSRGERYVFWPMISAKLPSSDQLTSGTAPTHGQWEIRLAWSQYKDGTWTPKSLAQDEPLVFDVEPSLTIDTTFRFMAESVVGGIDVKCYGVKIVPITTNSPASTGSASITSVVANVQGTPGTFFFDVLAQDAAGNPLAGVGVSTDLASQANRASLAAESIVATGPPDPNLSYGVTDSSGHFRTNAYLCSSSDTTGPNWTVAVALWPGLAQKYQSPVRQQLTVAEPQGLDSFEQAVRVTAVFVRKPVVTQVPKLAGFGLFHMNLRGEVSAVAWDWNQQYALDPPPNCAWDSNGLSELQGSADDALYVPDLPQTPLLPHTPETFHVGLLNQPYVDPGLAQLEPVYVLECADKSYWAHFDPLGSNVTATLRTLFHPQAQRLKTAASLGDESEVLALTQQQQSDFGNSFRSLFLANAAPQYPLTAASVPVEEVGFEDTDFFGGYNWELFFHLPLMIAGQLTANQRFADARRWLHFIFDPTDASAQAASQPARVWKFLPFLNIASQPPAAVSDFFGPNLQAQLTAMSSDPFNPFAIARLRPIAFMKNVVMRYLDNLLAWGDQLFALDTIESMNEATQIYLLGRQILGPRPDVVPPRATPTVQTYQSLSAAALTGDPLLSQLGLIAVNISSFMPLSALPAGASGAGVASMMYFCLPDNDQLLDYWKQFDDRLFKLRNCLDIGGTFRVPALYEPPIDPGLLVRARAAGLDIADVLAETTAPLPNYRFTVLVQRALELVAEVKALGASLLQVLEKRDAEALVLLRQKHEIGLLRLTELVREKQLQEAAAQVEALNRSQNLATLRREYYARVLGKTDTSGTDPIELAMPTAALGSGGADADAQDLSLSQHELDNLSWLKDANNFTIASGIANTVSGLLHLIPEINTTIHWGGSNLGSAAGAVGSLLAMLSANASFQGARASTIGSFARRRDDWTLQHNVAVREWKQVNQQIVAGQLRSAIAEQELTNHRQQMTDADEIEQLLKSKFTSQQLYDWMLGRLTHVYSQGYRLALQVSKWSERAYRRELGLADTSFIGNGYWDDLRKGLAAGELLHQDLRRMNVAYLEENVREFEITKHVSMLSLDPLALAQLKMGGSCEVEIPEWSYDLDYPGHYLRRVKSVSISIPCVVGPYSGVNCTLTLLSSTVRVSADASQAYPRAQNHGVPADDSRFLDQFGVAQAIATSNAQNDSGLFETNLRDERYLPFEGQGAVGRWRIEVPSANNSVDPNTVSDVILHIRYTARGGGAGLAKIAQDSAATILKSAATQPLVRLFSARQEFPDVWQQFTSGAAAGVGPLGLNRGRFPLLFSRSKIVIDDARSFFVVKRSGITNVAADPNAATTVTLRVDDTAAHMQIATLAMNIPLSMTPDGNQEVPLDLLVACAYHLQ